jgi:hypothetical protein
MALAGLSHRATDACGTKQMDSHFHCNSAAHLAHLGEEQVNRASKDLVSSKTDLGSSHCPGPCAARIMPFLWCTSSQELCYNI